MSVCVGDTVNYIILDNNILTRVFRVCLVDVVYNMLTRYVKWIDSDVRRSLQFFFNDCKQI